MTKKLVIGGVLLLLVIGSGGFFVWQNGKDARELNKNLPKGVRVVKSLFGDEYRVVNKLDGYAVQLPGNNQTWEGTHLILYNDLTNDDEINYRHKLEPTFQDSIMSETELVVSDKIFVGQDRTFTIRKFLFREPINLREFVGAFYLAIGLTESKYTKFPFVINTFNVGEKTVEKLSITMKSPNQPEAPFWGITFFEVNSKVYSISASIENSDQFIQDIILSGNW